jgi:hypothetical protein
MRPVRRSTARTIPTAVACSCGTRRATCSRPIGSVAADHEVGGGAEPGVEDQSFGASPARSGRFRAESLIMPTDLSKRPPGASRKGDPVRRGRSPRRSCAARPAGRADHRRAGGRARGAGAHAARVEPGRVAAAGAPRVPRRGRRLTDRVRIRAAGLWAGDRGTVSGPAAAWWQRYWRPRPLGSP